MDERDVGEEVPNQDAGPRSRRGRGTAIEDPEQNYHLGWDKGITYEADARHVEIMVEQLKPGGAKTATTPGTKDEGKNQEDSETKFGREEAQQYMAFVARCNYLGPDRPDIAYSVK